MQYLWDKETVNEDVFIIYIYDKHILLPCTSPNEMQVALVDSLSSLLMFVHPLVDFMGCPTVGALPSLCDFAPSWATTLWTKYATSCCHSFIYSVVLCTSLHVLWLPRPDVVFFPDFLKPSVVVHKPCSQTWMGMHHPSGSSWFWDTNVVLLHTRGQQTETSPRSDVHRYGPTFPGRGAVSKQTTRPWLSSVYPTVEKRMNILDPISQSWYSLERNKLAYFVWWKCQRWQLWTAKGDSALVTSHPKFKVWDFSKLWSLLGFDSKYWIVT